MSSRFILRGLIVILLLAGAGFLLGDLLDKTWIDQYVRDTGFRGQTLFVLAGGLLISLGLSRQFIAFLGGYGFGFVQGALLGMVAVIGGCITTFYVARLLVNSTRRTFQNPRIQKASEFLHENTFSMTLLIRLLPAGSNWVVNLAAGATGIRSLPFFTGSALGFVPQMLIFALVGGGTQVGQVWQVGIAMILLVVAGSLGVYLYRKSPRLPVTE